MFFFFYLFFLIFVFFFFSSRRRHTRFDCDWSSDVCSSDLNSGKVATIGEEVLSRYWVRSDSGAPVKIQQLAAFHSQGYTATVRWSPKGGTGGSIALVHEAVDGQSILPRVSGGEGLAIGTFNGPSATATNPEKAFQFRIDNTWSNDEQNTPVTDRPTDEGHHVRFFPARDRDGQIIPDTWLMVMDYLGINYDYQDNVYLISNMRPAPAEAPTGVVAQDQQGAGVGVNWDDSPEKIVSGYNVYRSTSETGPYAKLNATPVTASEFLDTTAATGVTYYYKVSAVHDWGGESQLSAPASGVRSTDTTPPSAPTGLAAENAGGGIRITWFSNTEPDLAGYKVYRSDTEGGEYFALNGGSAVAGGSFLDTSAEVGATYFYKITAVDTSGNESGQSGAAGATRTVDAAPAAPAGLAALGELGGVKLTWTANTETDLAGYRIYRSDTADGAFVAINGGNLVTAATFTDTGMAAGERRYYRVTAVDVAGNESPASATADAARVVPTPTPTVIRINTAGAGYTDSLGRTWDPDRNFSGGTISTSAFSVLNTADDSLYYPRRYGAFSYSIP